jgi:microcompartment protein CcmL/EutN
MVKASNVTIVGKERVDPAMITIKIVGEVAAVKSAVDAGAAAAKRVGELVSVHIIPQPDEQLISILPEISDKSKPEILPAKESKEIETIPKEIPVEKKPKVREIAKKKISPSQPEKYSSLFDKESDTITRLRREALGSVEKTEKKIKGKESSSNEPLKKFNNQDISTLNVHELRHLARSIEGFPIQGRQISRANRKELIDFFNSLS